MKSIWIMLHTHEVVGSNPSRPTTESRVSNNQSLGPFLFATRSFLNLIIKRIHIGIVHLHRDDRPWVSTGSKHHVHQKPCHASIAIHIRVDVDKDKMSQYCANPRTYFF